MTKLIESGVFPFYPNFEYMEASIFEFARANPEAKVIVAFPPDFGDIPYPNEPDVNVYYLKANPAAICGFRSSKTIIVDYHRFDPDILRSLVIGTLAVRRDNFADYPVEFVASNFYGEQK